MKIGYYQGTWDVLHVGHINALEVARSLCDYLLVGVATNEFYFELKHRQPARDWSDRMAVVRAIKYVSAVIPYSTLDPYDIWIRMKYDVFFVSDEYCTDYHKTHTLKNLYASGVTIFFLPRTPAISSSEIKQVIKAM